jgi:hypothetical protein
VESRRVVIRRQSWSVRGGGTTGEPIGSRGWDHFMMVYLYQEKIAPAGLLPARTKPPGGPLSLQENPPRDRPGSTSILEHESFGPHAVLTSEGRKVRAIAPGFVQSDRHGLPAGGALGLLFRSERIKQKILVGTHRGLRGPPTRETLDGCSTPVCRPRRPQWNTT